MLDFVMPCKKLIRVYAEDGSRKSITEIYPVFLVKNESNDLMIRGGDFYAVWDEDTNLWSTSEQTVIDKVEVLLRDYKKQLVNNGINESNIRIAHMWNSDSGIIDKWHRFCQRQMRDSYKPLDNDIVFLNTPTTRESYASKRLPYNLESGACDAYEELMSTLYDPDERRKLEWAIGAIISGESKLIQKFIVLYGEPGSGKGTVLKIIMMLFDGYYSVFKAKELASSNNSFALEDFKNNPLVSIDTEADLSRIEDNTLLNSLVAHEEIVVNEKFKSKYSSKFNTFIFAASNKPVKITDAKSGLLRRLIDVNPSGRKIKSEDHYLSLVHDIQFELGHIAQHCLDVYNRTGRTYYNSYAPTEMMALTNDFYDFIESNFDIFVKEDGVTLKQAWAMYNDYCEFAGIEHKMPMRAVRGELKNYFERYDERIAIDGNRVRNYYSGFKTSRFYIKRAFDSKDPSVSFASWLTFDKHNSLLDILYQDEPAQYAKEDGTPFMSWDKVTTTLKDLDTSRLHYVIPPKPIGSSCSNHVVMDFDKRDPVTGEKSLELNLKAAAKWPKTYAELSKSGCGIHLHYIYNGDVSELAGTLEENVELKTFPGKSALRRMVTLCNDIPITTISSGLPLKEKKGGDSKVTDLEALRNEKAMRAVIMKALRREVWPNTAPSVDFICKVFKDNYEAGTSYDISDLEPAIIDFASQSTHQANECMKKVMMIEFKSEDKKGKLEVGGISQDDTGNDNWEDQEDGDQNRTQDRKSFDEKAPIVFFDVEVFPNLFIICWKYAGKNSPVVKMINPSPVAIEELLSCRLVGFNNRRYDNHIVLAAWKGATNAQLYGISQGIINGADNALCGDAYDISYTDIYDYCSKKQSLKKWEIELGIHHQELGLAWDQPVDPELWETVANYCVNDVIATEAVWEKTQADFKGRMILCDLANILVGPGSTVNDTTNTLTTKLIVGNDRNPQKKFIYPNLAEEFPGYEFCATGIDKDRYISKDYIISGKSFYHGYDPGEGGFAFGRKGAHGLVKTFDIASMHPSSIKAENGFGEYTENFTRLLDIRLLIKHKDFDAVKAMFNGALAPYLTTKEDAKALSYALKIAINSVYGLTAAHFPNKLRDPRNVDNWVAKRGALFMITLMMEIEKLGYEWCHIKTDSIKIVNPDERVEQFIMDFGKKYGYTFEVEAEYDRFCLVNKSVYISRYSQNPVNEHPGEWDATGKEFQVPYVFKKLFTKEEIEFKDLCTTMTAQTALYLDMNEDQNFLRQKIEEEGDTGSKISPLCTEILKDGSKLYHSYHFVGRAGSFCPIIPGRGGGILLREQDGNYHAVQGTKKEKKKLAPGEEPVWRWLEAEVVKDLEKEDDICYEYWDEMAEDAKAHLCEYCDYNSFIAPGPYFGDFMNIPDGAGDEVEFKVP